MAGQDIMKREIESNYKRIKLDIVQIIETELERIKNDPNLQHLVQDNKPLKWLLKYLEPFSISLSTKKTSW